MLLLASNAALAITAHTINLARATCTHGTANALAESAPLDAVAAQLARGDLLEEALAVSTYHASEATAFPVTESSSEDAVLASLTVNYCGELAATTPREVGLAERGGTLWVVIASPLAIPDATHAELIRDEILALINEARSAPRRCGTRLYGAAPALSLSAQLSTAAQDHAEAMARTGTFEHTGDDGRTPADRVRATHYHARVVGENIAAGMGTAAEAVRGWLQSPDHCENVMDAHFTDLGVAFATNLARDPAVYWTLDLAESHGAPPLATRLAEAAAARTLAAATRRLAQN